MDGEMFSNGEMILSLICKSINGINCTVQWNNFFAFEGILLRTHDFFHTNDAK